MPISQNQIYQKYLVTLKIDDVTCGTKSTTTQDVLDTSYVVKGLIVHRFLNSDVS